MRTGTKEPILLDGSNLLFVQIGGLSFRLWFGVVENLVVDVLLGTSFIDRYIHGIFHSKREVAPWNSLSAPILIGNRAVDLPRNISEEDREETSVAAIRVARKNCDYVTYTHVYHNYLVSHRFVSTWTHTTRSQFYNASCHTRDNKTTIYARILGIDFRLTKQASAIIEAYDTRSWKSTDSVRRQLRHGREPFKQNLERNWQHSSCSSTGAKRNREDQINRHEKVHSSDSKQAKTDWKEEVNMSNNYLKYRQEFIQMLESFYNIWDGLFGRIIVAKLRIQLDPGATHINSVPYKAGPKVREFRLVEIARMLDKKKQAMEPATTKWAAPIVFTPKKNGTIRSCLDYRRPNVVGQRGSYPIRVQRLVRRIYQIHHSRHQQQVLASEDWWRRQRLNHFLISSQSILIHTIPVWTQESTRHIWTSHAQNSDPGLAANSFGYLDDIVKFSKTPEEHIAQ